ncbi:hypothetical protein Tco_1010368 [Tanacetum coccineum]
MLSTPVMRTSKYGESNAIALEDLTLRAGNLVNEEINEVQDKGYISGRYFRNLVKTDSEDSTITYTAVSSLFEGLLDIGSLGIDGPPMMSHPQTGPGRNTQDGTSISMDIAKISRKRSKPDKHEHENGIECAKSQENAVKSQTMVNSSQSSVNLSQP